MKEIIECQRLDITKELLPFVYKYGVYKGMKKTVECFCIPNAHQKELLRNIYEKTLKPLSDAVREATGINKAVSIAGGVDGEPIFVFWDYDANKLTFSNQAIELIGDKYVLFVDEESEKEE